ncbi:hypothetical protein Rhe02_32340 [Rhizocola hellebori]|uniref:Cupin type-2 domain-containing protein n=1 Tax=Rhizocola hellebori TaxID=1392758 RepID=A0A8J3Q8H8_9ACTN|nr:cupin domain-containing protein [Rhizocola hellebori]GIH05167.1 hypothetical protein Rhe02_32340 [Rhizocola hellebori]
MLIHRFDRAGDAQRLSSWPVLNAPFDGEFCIVKAHSAVLRHAHREYELLVAVAGEAVVESKVEQIIVHRGDVVHFTPFVDHRVINGSDRDFEMFSMLWSRDLCDRFLRRHLDMVTRGADRWAG